MRRGLFEHLVWQIQLRSASLAQDGRHYSRTRRRTNTHEKL
jgi:hypothetical protein